MNQKYRFENMISNMYYKVWKLLEPLRNQIYLTKLNKYKNQFPEFATPILLIAMPGCLCVLARCLDFIPQKKDVVIFCNGLEDWETNYIKEHFRFNFLVTHDNTPFQHSMVLDYVMDAYKKPFIALDYDCFVLEADLFDKMSIIDDDIMVNTVYALKNPDEGLVIPETFFMTVNSPLINMIKSKYKVTSDLIRYDNIPARLIREISKVSIDKDHPIEFFKKEYMDTGRLWMALGLKDGYKFNFIEQFSIKETNRCFHIGAGHMNDRFDSYWYIRGSYFWRKALECCHDEEIKKRYYQKYGTMTSAYIRENALPVPFPVENAFYEKVDEILQEN